MSSKNNCCTFTHTIFIVVRLAKIQPHQGASPVWRRYWEVRLVFSLSRKQISLMFTADDLWIKNGICLQADHCFLTQRYHHSTTLTVYHMTLMRVPSGCTCLLGGSLKFANFFLLWGPDIGDRLQSRDKRQLRVSNILQVDAFGLKLNQLIVSQSAV